ncbi:MAG TPA: hypothetical protein VFI08_10270 [Spirochaetia bacterium]|nr:hypothetical protein [Spirochaetia bacterium]
MRGECTEKHLATLRRRYGEKRLCEAAARREHLNYQRLSIGDSPGSGRVKSLLAQMHQTYYFGFAEGACILAGTLLEQGLIYRLGAALDERGPLPFTHGGEQRWLQTRHDLLELELVDMLELAREQGIITEGRTLLLAHQIRWIRNMVVHEKIPVFKARDEGHLELTVTKSRRGRVRYARILMDTAEVAALPEPGGPASATLTAYFCVSRTRMVLRTLLKSTEAKRGDESGGSLLLWSES